MSHEAVVAIICLVWLCSALAVAATLWLFSWINGKFATMSLELKCMTVGKDWGEVRLDQFALKCDVHAAVANWYLSRKSRQLNGVRHVNEWGDVVFLFGEAKQKFLSE